jgi:hypothetical protein
MYQKDGSWCYEETDRVTLHEAAHCLVDLIFTGTTNTIDLDTRGGAECRKVWDPDLRLASDDNDQAFLVWGVHSCRAGYVAEELAFLSADIRGCSHDLLLANKALAVLEMDDFHMKISTVDMLIRSLLKQYARPWRACASALRVGRTPSADSKHALLTYDNSESLRKYAEDPIMAGPHWRVKYLALKDMAAIAYAKQYLDLSA